VLDRLTGKVISAEPFAQVNWASKIDLVTGRPVVNPGAYYGKDPVTIMPGAGGAHNWAPMAFNPLTNLMYIPTSANSSGTYRVAEDFAYQPGRTNLGTTFGGGPRGAPTGIPEPGQPPPPPPDPNTATALPIIGPRETGGWLVAIDPSTQKEKWRARGGGSIGGGALTTASNLVFQVINNGHLLVYKADTGEKLLDLNTNQTIGMGPPITFMASNKQYVAVAGGRGSVGNRGNPTAVASTTGPAVAPRLYVYTLDGKAENPTPAPPPAAAAPAPGGN
jgi:glucose dehydrogenase